MSRWPDRGPALLLGLLLLVAGATRARHGNASEAVVYPGPYVLSSVVIKAGVGDGVRGTPCVHAVSGRPGLCRPLPQCASAVQDRLEDRHPQLCGFPSGFTLVPNVCCPDNPNEPSEVTVPSAPDDRESTRPLDKEQVVSGDQLPQPTSCGDFNASVEQESTRLNAPMRSGSIARRMCLQYQRDICSDRIDRKDNTDYAVFGYGFNPADLLEYPHMALLGYGDGSIEYKCGGSLISPDFVLTAAHCITGSSSKVRWVLLGAQNRTQSAAHSRTRQLLEVAEVVVHPEYSVRARYHDVALLRLAKPAVVATEDVRPACLHTELDTDGAPGDLGVVTGWGAEEFGGEASERLLKGNVTVRQLTDCRAMDSKLPRGLDELSHICAGGDGRVATDACSGDSGGPLQFPALQSNPQCMHRVAGIVSFGPPCGLGAPGVYTRVASYVPWIEGIVWPRAACVPDTEPGTAARRACQQFLINFCGGQLTRVALPGLRREQLCHYQQGPADDLQGSGRFEFAGPTEFPHQVLLRYGSDAEVGCSGALISPRFVLTAAHCAAPDCAGPVIEVLLGVVVRSSKPMHTVRVDAVIVHPEFDAVQRSNDVALLRLAEDLPASLHVRPACLHTVEHTPASLVASGLTAEGPWDSVYGELRKARLDMIAECGQDDSRLCARGRGNVTAPGEMGGPLQFVHRVLEDLNVYTIAGVLSMAAPCGSGRPEVYAKVAAFVPWIERIVWPEQ